MENLANKIDGASAPFGVLPAKEWNQPLNEIQKIITSHGITLEDVEQGGVDVSMLASALTMAVGAADFYTGSGTADVQVLTTISPKEKPRTYLDGMRIRWLPSNGNANPAVTIDVDAIGVINLKDEIGTSDINIGDLATTRYAEAVYDGTNFRLLARTLTTVPPSRHPGYHSRGGAFQTLSATDFHITPIKFRGQLDVLNGDLNTTIVKEFDQLFALGTAAGAFPAAVTRTASKWYNLFLIIKTDGTIDCGIDDVYTATNLLAAADAISGGSTWDDYFQIGFIRADKAVDTNFTPMTHNPTMGNLYQLNFGVECLDSPVTTVTANVAQLLRMEAPPLTHCEVAVSMYHDGGGSSLDFFMWLCDPGMTAPNVPIPTTKSFNLSSRSENNSDNDIRVHGNVIVKTDSSGRMKLISNASNTRSMFFDMNVNAYYYEKGSDPSVS